LFSLLIVECEVFTVDCRLFTMPKKKPSSASTSYAQIHRDRQRLPDVLVQKFGQFGFVKWTSAFCPVLIVDPMELIQQKVLPEGIYHAWMYKIDLSLEDDKNQVPALIYWYGTTYEFSVVALRDVVPFNQGKALGYDTVPDFMARRMDLDMSVPAVYQLVRGGMEELQIAALKLPPAKRATAIVHPKRRRQVVLNEWHALSMDPPCQQQLWLEKRDRLLGKLPNAEHFGTIGFLPFTKGGNKQHYHPILILSPFRVPPGPIRKEWFHKCSSKQMVLVYWFGAYICGRPQSAYSFSYLSQVTSWETGTQLGYDQLPPYALQEYYGSTNTRPSRNTNDTSKRTIAQRVSWMADWLVCGHWELHQALSKETQNRWGGLEDFEEEFADDFEFYWECIEAAEITIQAKRQLQNQKKQPEDKNPASVITEPHTSTNRQYAATIRTKDVKGTKKKLSTKSTEQNDDNSVHESTTSREKERDQKIRSKRRNDGRSQENGLKRLPLELENPKRGEDRKAGLGSSAAGEVHSDGSDGRNKISKKTLQRSKKRRRSIDVEDEDEAEIGSREAVEDSEVERSEYNAERHGGNDNDREDKLDPGLFKSEKPKGKKIKRRRHKQGDESKIGTFNIPDKCENRRKAAPKLLDQSDPKRLKKGRRNIELHDDEDEIVQETVAKTVNSSKEYVPRADEASSKNTVASFRIPRKSDKRNKHFDASVEEKRAQVEQDMPYHLPKLKGPKREEFKNGTNGNSRDVIIEEGSSRRQDSKTNTDKEAGDCRQLYGSGKAEVKKLNVKSAKKSNQNTASDSIVKNTTQIDGSASVHERKVDVGEDPSAESRAKEIEASQRKKDRNVACENGAAQDISIIRILDSPLAISSRSQPPASSFAVSVVQSGYSRIEAGKTSENTDVSQHLKISVDAVARKAVPRDTISVKADVSLVHHMTNAKFALVDGGNPSKASLDDGNEGDTSLDEAVQKSLLSCAAALKGDRVQTDTLDQPKNKRKKGKGADAKAVAVGKPVCPDKLAELKRQREETQEVVARVIEEWTKNKERMMKSK
jgi:hypothetical protein